MTEPAGRGKVDVRAVVIGAGHVGLPTAAALARLGHDVTCVERDPARFAALDHGGLPFRERGLDELVREGLASGRLRFARTADGAVQEAGFVFLCVPTPQGADGSADLTTLEVAVGEIGPYLRSGAVLVNKCTVPVGTAALVERMIGRPDVSVVSNPEFLREGWAVHDSLHPERIVIGGGDERVVAGVGELFSGTGAPVVATDTTTAETIKYAANAFLAVKISFANALSQICELLGADVADAISGLGHDRRIGFDSLHPGPGWGGSCLPKDTAALLNMVREAGYDFGLLREAVTVNQRQIEHVVEKVVAGRSLVGHRVGVWGLTFKAGTDDRRESPALAVARRLLELGARVAAFDPTVTVDARDEDLTGMTLCGDAYEAARGASAVVVLTEWDELRCIDFEKVLEIMAHPRVVDARNVLDPTILRNVGFDYCGVGGR